MPELLSRFKATDNGARFYKVDLHFHTPASYDYKDKTVSYKRLVEKAIEQRIDMIAVTDHNIGIGYEKMLSEARNTKLVILPGVEITVEGIHILGVFPEKEDAADITYLLHRVQIRDEDMGKKETISSIDLSIPQVLDEIASAGGIAIAAHVDGTSGLTTEIKGLWRIALVQRKSLKVVEVRNMDNKKYFDGKDPYYKRKLSCVRSSDAHHPDEIGQRATWIKMGECNFRGLKQIIYEPDLRISFIEPQNLPYPKIIGMEVSGGLYEGELFHFNKNLNCIIGGRGAGKSAIIDFIRFALNYPPRSKEHLREFNERIVKLLGLGNVVKVYVENKEGLFLIERELTDYNTERISGKEEKVNEVFSREKTYQIVDNLPTEIEKRLHEVLEIEVFGQGEVFELTRRADNQLKLIDEYIQAEEFFKEQKLLIEQLQENATIIVELKKEISELEEELKGLTGLKTKIKNLEQELKADIFKKHRLWESEYSYFREVAKELKFEREKIESVIEKTEYPKLPILEKKSPNWNSIEKIEKLFAQLFKNLETSRRNELTTLSDTRGKIKEIYQRWKVKFELEQKEFAAKLQDLGVSDQRVLSNQLSKLKEKEFRLEKKVKPLYDKKIERLSNCEIERTKLLNSLENTRKSIHKRRKHVVEKMSEELEKGDVKIKINYQANRVEFFELLNRIYVGSDMRRRKEQLQKIVSSITPIGLTQLIQEADIEETKERFEITEDTAKKLIQTPDLKNIFEMEVCPLHDELVIYLRKAKGEDFSPLKDLSYGEKCTAVFSIALLGKEKPLLVDQPEDELDHAFVIKNIVEHIRSIKERRQLLVATHNANIPVLGDSELIYKVGKVPGAVKCKVEERGAFEKESIIDRLQDLEGGPDAFRRRREKYGIKEE